MGETQVNERQARELAPLLRKATPEVVREVYAEAVAETNGKATAAVIRNKVRKILPAKEKKPPTIVVDLRPEGLFQTVELIEQLVSALALIRGNEEALDLEECIAKLEWASEEITRTLHVLRERSNK